MTFVRSCCLIAMISLSSCSGSDEQKVADNSATPQVAVSQSTVTADIPEPPLEETISSEGDGGQVRFGRFSLGLPIGPIISDIQSQKSKWNEKVDPNSTADIVLPDRDALIFTVETKRGITRATDGTYTAYASCGPGARIYRIDHRYDVHYKSLDDINRDLIDRFGLYRIRDEGDRLGGSPSFPGHKKTWFFWNEDRPVDFSVDKHIHFSIYENADESLGYSTTGFAGLSAEVSYEADDDGRFDEVVIHHFSPEIAAEARKCAQDA